MIDKALCSVCGEGHVMDYTDQVKTEYKGAEGVVPMHYKQCDACGSDYAGPDESRLNKRAMLAFRKSVDGLLSGAEIVDLRKRYGINQKQAARLFGGGPVAFSKYENDDVAHSESMDKLLRLALKSEVSFWELVELKGMSEQVVRKKSRTSSHLKILFQLTETNVIEVEFSQAHAAPTLIAAANRYQGLDEPKENRQWKH